MSHPQKPFPLSRPGDYCEYVDENDEKGLVQFCRRNGAVFLVMSSSEYDMYKEHAKTFSALKIQTMSKSISHRSQGNPCAKCGEPALKHDRRHKQIGRAHV